MEVTPIGLSPVQNQIFVLVAAAMAALVTIATLVFLITRTRFDHCLAEWTFVFALVDPSNDAGGVECVSARQLGCLFVFFVPVHADDAIILNHCELV